MSGGGFWFDFLSTYQLIKLEELVFLEKDYDYQPREVVFGKKYT